MGIGISVHDTHVVKSVRPVCQRSHISRSPFYSVASGGVTPSRSVVPLAPANIYFSLFMERLARMRELLLMCKGVEAFPARSATPSRSLLSSAETRPPLLQSRAWQIMNLKFQPSLYVRRSEGAIPYHRKRASPHSCAPSSVPFTVDSCTVSQAPVFVFCRSRHALWTRPLPFLIPVPPTPAVDSVAKPPFNPPGDRPSGMPSGTPPGP